VENVEIPAPTPIYTFPTTGTAANPPPVYPPGPNDSWGRPAGHPHFGIPPASVSA
jgi:hypothetical protein